ncbi:hypothetical protein [Thiohalorhabdus methylotrophus]|uniref:Uncharacterized protein n=1 Tax=Thiohalorhabdus methylotrophus TaxID=3242694 RepID=A0ABV4TRR1_9GAMM
MNQQRVPLSINPDSLAGEEKYRVSGAPLRGQDWWFSLDGEGNASIVLADNTGSEEDHLVIDLSPNEDATRAQLREADLLTLAYWLRAAAVEYLTGYGLEEIPRSEWEAVTEGSPVQ